MHIYLCTYILVLSSIGIMQPGINHDKPYFSNISGVNMLMFMANYYTFCKQDINGYKTVWHLF